MPILFILGIVLLVTIILAAVGVVTWVVPAIIGGIALVFILLSGPDFRRFR